MSATPEDATGPHTTQQDDFVTRTEFKRIINIKLVHVPLTSLSDMLSSMTEESFMDSLHDGAVEVSESTARQSAQNVIESIVNEKLRASIIA